MCGTIGCERCLAYCLIFLLNVIYRSKDNFPGSVSASLNFCSVFLLFSYSHFVFRPLGTPQFGAHAALQDWRSRLEVGLWRCWLLLQVQFLFFKILFVLFVFSIYAHGKCCIAVLSYFRTFPFCTKTDFLHQNGFWKLSHFLQFFHLIMIGKHWAIETKLFSEIFFLH